MRAGEVARSTNETKISVSINLDGDGKADVATQNRRNWPAAGRLTSAVATNTGTSRTLYMNTWMATVRAAMSVATPRRVIADSLAEARTARAQRQPRTADRVHRHSSPASRRS